jgi:hypothetical protein
LTPGTEASELTIWRWGVGEESLPDLWTDRPAAFDADRARRFREENRPHDRSGRTPVRELEKHEDVLADAVKACIEAVEMSGLPRDDVLGYVALALRMGELFGRKGEGDQSEH